MAFHPQRLVGGAPLITRQSLTRRDTLLYALGVGAEALPFVYEDGLQALPTMAVALAYPGLIWRDPAVGADWRKVLHAETWIELDGALPVEGELVGETRFEAVDDKGEKGAVAYLARKVMDAAGRTVATVRNTSFLRGDGGCGDAGQPPPPPAVPPERAPDLVHTLPTAANQALIYRLSGDYNPLHLDPAAAQAAGFPRPILHGLCSFGVAGRSVLAALCDDEPAQLRRLGCRFTSPVFPGETLETQIWRDGDVRARFRTRVVERDRIVLDCGAAELA